MRQRDVEFGEKLSTWLMQMKHNLFNRLTPLKRNLELCDLAHANICPSIGGVSGTVP